jgi:hypothetical protein
MKIHGTEGTRDDFIKPMVRERPGDNNGGAHLLQEAVGPVLSQQRVSLLPNGKEALLPEKIAGGSLKPYFEFRFLLSTARNTAHLVILV